MVFLPPPIQPTTLGGIAQRSRATRYRLLSRYVCLLIPANHLLIVQYSFHVQVCVKCRLDEIVPYIPNIDAEGVLRSGPSPSIKALAPAIAQDIPPLQLYLSTLNQLSKEISDTRNQVRHLCPVNLCSEFCHDHTVPSTPCPTDAALSPDPSPSIKGLPLAIAHDIIPFQADLDQLFRDISDRCSRVRKEIEYHEAALAPIQSLPTDLLIDIFMLVPVNALKPLSSPWIFGQVCVAWRSLSFSSPSLWSRIIIDDFYGLPGPKVEAALEIYLFRSKAHPLSFCLDSLTFPDPAGDFNPITHLSIIVAHASRWTSVQLDVTSSQLTKLLEMIHELPRCIRILEIYVHEDPYDGESYLPYKPTFSLSPIAHGTIYGVSTSMLPVFLGKLTTLCCELKEPSGLTKILEQATELETLHIVPEPSVGSSDSLKSYGPTVYHPILRRLTIFVYRTQRYVFPVVPISVDSISISGLRELELITHDIPGIAFMPLFDSEDMARIHSLLQRSGCALDILRIHSPLPWSDVLPILAAQWQSLTTLHLFVNTDIALQLFRALSAESNTPRRPAAIDTILLPNLQHLTLSEEPRIGTDIGMMKSIGALYDAILSRWGRPDVKQLACLRLILVDQPLEALRHNPATGFGLLHLIGLKSFILNVNFLVGGDDILEAGGWLELLGEE